MLKGLLFVVGIVCIGVLVACQTNTAASPAAEPEQEAEPATEAPAPSTNASESDESPHMPAGNCGTVVSATDLNLLQNQLPNRGDTIAILHTNMGDITIRFFPEETPKAYENFVTHARNGYYDGVIFHRVIENFMIQGGDPEGTGMGGESIWGEGFGAEFSRDLRHFRGALSMAQSAMPNSIGSQFFIVRNQNYEQFTPPQVMGTFQHARDNQDEFIDTDPEGNRVYMHELVPLDKILAYERYGGTPHLDLVFNQGGHTVFGQVIRGMEVVDAIAEVEVGANDRPVSEVIIERVTVTTF